jgi:hypothetical protein
MRNKPPSTYSNIAASLTSPNKEAARALPSSKGGEPQGQLQTYRTAIYSYFTVVDPAEPTKLLYNAENWVRIKLELQTAGPVAVGTLPNLAPLLGGGGRLLPTNQEREFFLPRGTRIYIMAQSVNRVSVTIEPIPWLEQISETLRIGFSAVAGGIQGARAMVAELMNKPGAAKDESAAPRSIPAAVAARATSILKR